MKSTVFFLMGDWGRLEEVTREMLPLINDGLVQRPGDSEMLVTRAFSQHYLGAALTSEGKATDAIPILEEAAAGFRDAPPALEFAGERERGAGETTFFLAEALAKTGNRARARALSESHLAELEAFFVKDPADKSLKIAVAQFLVQLAELLDPAKTAEASRRLTLLDRADKLMQSVEVLGQRPVADQELIEKIAALRGTTVDVKVDASIKK